MIVWYHRLAREETIEAAQYYDRERTGLGAEFLAELDEAEARIAANPL